MAIERVVEYMLKVQKSSSHWLPKIAWEANRKIQMTYKSKILCSSHQVPRIEWEANKKIQKTDKSNMLCSDWMQDMEKWFGRLDTTFLLHDASLDSSLNEAFLQRQCIMTWDKCGGSRITHYTTHVAPNYMLEPIPLSGIGTIVSMQLSSHALWCETKRWGIIDESDQFCTLCPK